MPFTKVVSASLVHELRARVLRPGRAVDESLYPGDDAPTTFHMATFLGPEDGLCEPKIVTVSSYFLEPHKYFPEAVKPYRLRGMASEPDLQGRGFGALALNAAQKILAERGCDLLWFNAREIAFGFYEKLGFAAVGSMFEIPHIGPHKVMFKKL